ncbi:MAG: enoyl-CoA hydratase [Chloroflexi bacterium RBG_16_64_32]|nr:MAG: enoyl-CoA hydratase [Chloroflexi bacterium RBG_16_64_32]
MSDYPDLLYHVESGIATITLNRPDRLNAITMAMLTSLSGALREADQDTDVRVIVLTGAGRGFCAGLDIKDVVSGTGIGADGAGLATARFDLAGSPPVVLHTTDKPVICALNGAAAGYGMDIALGCDIRIASREAKLAAVFTKRGILPESGGSWLLPRLIGWAKAAEVAFRGLTLSAQESLELGLVNRVVEPDELMPVTMEMATEIAANAPLAVQATKRMMRLGLEETFEANVHHVFLQLLPLFQTEDFREGMRSFLEKRPARFQGR